MTSKKLENMLSSRFIMPEHGLELAKFHKTRNIQKKPILLEDEWETINQVIGTSLNDKEPVNVTIFGEYGNTVLTGIVTNVNLLKKKFKLESEDGFDFVDFDEIVSVNLA